MSYLLSSALTNALSVPSLELKLEAFRAFIEEVAVLHDASYTVVNYIDEAVTDATSRRARLAVMGEPARYIEVLYAGTDGRWETEDDTRDVVNVFIYHGVGTASREVASDAFRALLASRSVTVPGILHAIRAQECLPIQGTETDLSGSLISDAAALANTLLMVAPTGQVSATLAYPEDFPQDEQYEAAFSVTLT